MIGTNRGDVAQPFAELLLLAERAKRRRAFGDGADPFHVLIRLNHMLQMKRGELQTPGIGQDPAGFLAEAKQVGMAERDHPFLQAGSKNGLLSSIFLKPP